MAKKQVTEQQRLIFLDFHQKSILTFTTLNYDDGSNKTEEGNIGTYIHVDATACLQTETEQGGVRREVRPENDECGGATADWDLRFP